MKKKPLHRISSLLAATVLGLFLLTGCAGKSAEAVQAQEDAQNAVEPQIKETQNSAEPQEPKAVQNLAEPQVQNLESAPKQPTSAAGNSEGSPRGRFSNVPSDRV